MRKIVFILFFLILPLGVFAELIPSNYHLVSSYGFGTSENKSGDLFRVSGKISCDVSPGTLFNIIFSTPDGNKIFSSHNSYSESFFTFQTQYVPLTDYINYVRSWTDCTGNMIISELLIEPILYDRWIENSILALCGLLVGFMFVEGVLSAMLK